MKFNTFMLAWSTFCAGYGLASGHWVTFGINLACAVYWTVSLILKNRKKTEPEVTISDEAREYFSSHNMKVVVNGKEIV